MTTARDDASLLLLDDRLCIALQPVVKRLGSGPREPSSRRPGRELTVSVRLTARGKRLRARAAGVPDEICEATGLALVKDARTISTPPMPKEFNAALLEFLSSS